MAPSNALMERLSMANPIIQAPMAGGADTPALMAAVCDAGGLGSMGATYLTPEAMGKAVAAVRAGTNRPFGINLFAPLAVPPVPADGEAAARRMAPFHQELGLADPAIPGEMTDPFADRFPLALESGARLFSFTFGIVPPDAIAAAKARDMVVMGTATSVVEAVALEAAGVDAVVAQGAEAGGHRGTFAGSFESSLVGTMALVPQVVDAVRLPVVASGGIMDGRGIAAALALGASAVQMGTAFLTCAEAGVPEAYKDAILSAAETDTALTRAFSGRYARGVRNRFMDEMSGNQPDNQPGNQPGNQPLSFPYQNALTRPMRTAAAAAGKSEYLSLWAGQGVRMARRQSARELVARLVDEMEATIAGLAT